MGTTKEVRGAVEAEFEFDPLVEDADIHVVNINGDVALNGTVPSYPQYLEAAAASQRVAGVRNMHNHLQVVLPGEDYRDDATLTTAANNALALNVTVPDGVEAAARDGNLRLTGAVEYGRQRKAAKLAVAGLVGIRNVRTTSTSATTPTRSTSPGSCRMRWTAMRWSTMTATSPWTPAATR